MSKLIRAWSLAYARSAVVGLMAAAAVLPLGCLCVFVPLWLVTRADVSIWVLILSASLYVVMLNGGTFAASLWILRRRKRRLDAAFLPLGLEGERYMLTGRQYHGAVQGHGVKVLFYRGPMLELHLETPLQTRFGVAEVSSSTPGMARLFNRQPLDLADPALEGLRVFALDEAWARALMADAEARSLIQRLMRAGESWALLRQVVLAPGAFRLRLYQNKHLFRFDITHEEAQGWIDDLLTLASTAEALPAPTLTDEESTAERMVRTGGTRSIALIAVALLVGVPTCVLAVAAAALFVWAIQ